MAKKKKRKQEQEEKKFQLPIEVHGIIYIILAILGFGPGKPLGLIGRLVRSFSTFLFGTWDVIFILILLVLGIYLILKKQYPSFFDKRLIGFYILLIGILVYSHLKYIELNDGNSIIFQESWNDIMSVINTIMNKSEFTTIGGGMIGCCLAIVFKILFDYQGTQIISIILMILGVCLFTGISIFDYLRKGVDKGKEIISKDKAKQDEAEEEGLRQREKEKFWHMSGSRSERVRV